MPVLGKSFSFTFRERMDFDAPGPASTSPTTRRPDADETAGVVGWYVLTEHPEGTHLETSMEITVDLPFPGLAPARRDHGHEGRRRASWASASRTTCSSTSARATA